MAFESSAVLLGVRNGGADLTREGLGLGLRRCLHGAVRPRDWTRHIQCGCNRQPHDHARLGPYLLL
jgi:hypothetical protein